MKSKELAVYIVDDDEKFRESLKELVSAMGYQAYGFVSAEDFLKLNSFCRPACLLLDIFLPNLNGLALQGELQARGVTLPIIFVTGHGDVPMSVKAIKKGAVDFLLKPFQTNDLRLAINSAHELDKQNVKEESRRKKILSYIATLTTREQEVMRQIITGKLNKQIAASMGTAEKTIRKHRGPVMKKMHVSSVADLVRALEAVGIVHSS